MKDHDELAAKLGDIGAKLQPFMSDLSDVETFLGADLSTANVRKASEMIQKSQAEAQTLKEEIAHVRTQLKQFVNDAPK